MFPQRNVGPLPFRFTGESAHWIARRLADPHEPVGYAAWYWSREPIERDNRFTRSAAPPDGIVMWTSRAVRVVALKFTWGNYWIAEAHLMRNYPPGEPLPELVTPGHAYDAATIHGETFWFPHDSVPSNSA